MHALADGSENVTRSLSVIYEWVEGRFKDIQSLEVIGARDWTHFSVDSYHFLVVASTSSSSSLAQQYSLIYFWDSGRFIPFQTIEVRCLTLLLKFAMESAQSVYVGAFCCYSMNFLPRAGVMLSRRSSTLGLVLLRDEEICTVAFIAN